MLTLQCSFLPTILSNSALYPRRFLRQIFASDGHMRHTHRSNVLELPLSFLTDLNTFARAAGAHTLQALVRLLAIGVEQGTSLLSIPDRWLMRDLDCRYEAVKDAQRQMSAIMPIDSDGRVTTYWLPLALPAQPCLFPQAFEDFHISTEPRLFSTVLAGKTALDQYGIPAQVQHGPAPIAGKTALDQHGIPAQDDGIPAQVQHRQSPIAGKTALDARARDDRNRIEGLSSPSGLSNRVAQIARTRTINPSLMAEGELVRARVTAFLRKSAAHPNSIPIADDRIVAQVLAIGPIPQILKHLDKIDTETHAVRDSHGYIVSVLINRILGADRQLIRDVFAAVKRERALGRGGQMTLDDYGIDADSLGRKIA